MKIVFLSKRRPQQKDLVTRPYGRFYFLPHLLAQKGHEITLALLSYKADPTVRFNQKGIEWTSTSVYNWGTAGYIRSIDSLIRRDRPDWIVGVSDTYYGIMAAYFGRKYGIHFAVDAYDNYESYLPWCKPLHLLWHKAIGKAEVVTAAGPQLARYLNRFRPHKKVHVVPMAADANDFIPLDKQQCRRKLNLPRDKKLIGYCGSINQNRGIRTVFSAFEGVHRVNPDTILILSGRLQKNLNLPANTRYLGYLSDDLVPILLNCMDVLLVPNQLTKFGNFSYSVKLYEAMSCQIPVVATATEPAKWILKDEAQFLAHPDDANDLAQKIMNAVQLDRAFYENQNSWDNSCDVFETALME